MATFAEVRDSLDDLEGIRLRAEEFRAKRAELLDRVVRVEADIAQIADALAVSEADFRAKAAALDFSKG